MKRKISLVVCMLILAVAMAFHISSVSFAADYDEAKARDTAESVFNVWNEMLAGGQFVLTDEDREQILAQLGEEGQSSIDIYDSWNALRDQLGNYVEITDASFTENEGIVTVTFTVKYEKGDMSFVVPVSASTYELAVSSFDEIKADYIKPMGQKMKEAGLNTLMGVGMVFILLIFMSFVISLFRFVNRPKKAEPAPAPAAPAPAAPVVEEVVEDVTDDCEIVAVITAAIMASMQEAGEEVPADGLVVRSIKRRNKKSWQNA